MFNSGKIWGTGFFSGSGEVLGVKGVELKFELKDRNANNR